MHRPASDRRGFTLVELLVVIVIIAMLMAMLLPAVNAVREAGRRATCTNNLFQQAFAAVRFNDSKRYIPGYRNFVTGSAVGYSWPVMILPNMERKDVYNAIVANPNSPPSVYISFFSCPSSPPDALTTPVLAYAGSVGVGSNATGARTTGVMLDISVTGTMSARVSMDDVAGNDGTATTLILSEECGTAVTNQGTWNFAPAANSGAVNWGTSTPVFGLMSTGTTTKVINNATFDNTIPSAANMPSSQHPGGAVVAFCDGHTGFLKDALSRHVYAQLMSWNQSASGTNATYTQWITMPAGGTYTVLSDGDYQ